MNRSTVLRRLFVASNCGLAIACGAAVLADNFVPSEVVANDTAVKIVDPEFDESSARFCWIEEGNPATTGDERLWVGYLNPKSGLFHPADGRGTRVELGTIIGVKSVGNGCEWVFTDAGAELVYTKAVGDGTLKDRTIGHAYFANGQWHAGILEGTPARSAPIGSLDHGDATPYIAYQGFTEPDVQGSRDRAVYVRNLRDPLSERKIRSTDHLFTPGARWVPGSNTAILTRPMQPRRDALRQAFSFNADSGRLRRLTYTDTMIASVYMWNAPEFNGEQIFMALEEEEYLGIYRQVPGGEGFETSWERAYIIDPPATGTYIWSPEVFVFKNKSYIVMNTSTSNDQQSLEVPTEIWVAGIDPNEPFYREISDDNERVRKDPEAVILSGDLPVTIYGHSSDYTLTEALTQSIDGQLLAVGASTADPAGGRNAIFAFELPVLESGQSVSQADFSMQLLTSASVPPLNADLWAVGVAGAGPLSYLESGQDPDENAVKIADDLLTPDSTSSSRVGLSQSQAQQLGGYLTDFYTENPDYVGGMYLYLRLNPDVNAGLNDVGWTVASGNHTSESPPSLALQVAADRHLDGHAADYALTEDLQIINGNQALPVGAVSGQAAGAEGRNAVITIALPVLEPGESVTGAELSFVLGGNAATPGLTADLWAIGISSSRPIRNYADQNFDLGPFVDKVSDNLLDESTPINRPIVTEPVASARLGNYLAAFYAENPGYQGGSFVHLRLNPDQDAGSDDAGWYIYSGENGPGVGPSMRLSVQAGDRVFVYISVGGTMYRLDTGIGASPE